MRSSCGGQITDNPFFLVLVDMCWCPVGQRMPWYGHLPEGYRDGAQRWWWHVRTRAHHHTCEMYILACRVAETYNSFNPDWSHIAIYAATFCCAPIGTSCVAIVTLAAVAVTTVSAAVGATETVAAVVVTAETKCLYPNCLQPVLASLHQPSTVSATISTAWSVCAHTM